MCKHAQQGHEELARRQRRLDARGNDVEATNRESDWAIGLVKNLPSDGLKLVNDHIVGLTKAFPKSPEGQKLALAIQGLGTGKDDPWQFASLVMDNSNGFKALIDHVGARLPEGVDAKYNDLKAKYPYLDRDRGRGAAPRIRDEMYTSKHVGITLSSGRSKAQKEALTTPITHGGAQFSSTQTSPTVQALVSQGAPFVGGASGTLRFICQEWDANHGEPHTIGSDELAEREKLIGVHSVLMMVAGHHSISECLMMVQAYGYFKDIPSPLTNYDKATQAFEKRLAKLGLQSPAPLSKATAMQGKSREQLAYEAELNELERERERLSGHESKGNKASLDRIFAGAAGLAHSGQWAKARDRLGDARAHLAYTAERVLQTEKGSPAVLKSEDLVQAFGNRKPHGGKKKSVAYKDTLASLDQYHASFKVLAKTPLATEFSYNAFRELREQLDGVERAALAYVAKHGRNRDKANEVAAMQALVAAVARERKLLTDLEENQQTTQEEQSLNLRDAIALQRAGGIQFAKPTLLSDQNLKRDKCRHLGSGGINQVRKLVYEPPGKGKQVRVFKAEDPNARVPDGPREIGITPGDPGFARRNVATRKLAEGLGLQDLVPDVDLVLVDGVPGIAMERAQGASLEKDEEEEVVGGASDDDIRRYNLRKDAKTGKVYTTRRRPNPMDLEGDPKIEVQYLKAMVNLQWLDAISGQIDRHERNYLIDIQGGVLTIKAIDNDFCFGDKHTSIEGIEGSDQPPGNLGQQYCGLPVLVDKAFHDHFKGLSLKDALGPGWEALTEGERKATELRLKEAQVHADKLAKAGCAVDKWETWKKDEMNAKEFLLGSKQPNYAKRDLKLNQGNQKKKKT
jgi:hypothetical protein